MGWANGEETDYDEGYTGHSPVNIRLQSIFALRQCTFQTRTIESRCRDDEGYGGERRWETMQYDLDHHGDKIEKVNALNESAAADGWFDRAGVRQAATAVATAAVMRRHQVTRHWWQARSPDARAWLSYHCGAIAAAYCAAGLVCTMGEP
jgi:hypothetical protein